MRPFNKTTATLVRPHPFSTLCPTPLGNSPVWIVSAVPGAGLLPGPALGVRAAAEVLVSGLGPAGAASREPGLCNDHVDPGPPGDQH